MASSYLNLLDVAKFNADDRLIPLIEENLNVAPEARLLPAMTIPGTTYDTLIRTNFPKPSFRAVNEGTDTVKSTYANKLVQCFYLDGQLEMDVAAARADARGETHALEMEASGIVQGALQKIGTQIWYGVNTTFGGDAKGFPGAVAVVDSSLVLDAGGTTDNTATSIYGLKLGERFVNLVFGQGNVFTLGQWRTQFVTRSSKEYEAWKNALNGYIGVQWVHKYAVGRIKKITADSGKTATDALIGQWLAKFPVGLRPDVLFMSRRTAYQLQSARSATSITNASPKGGTGMDIWAPQPESSNGIPIVITDSIVETETLAL
jgi:hypothetical protein